MIRLVVLLAIILTMWPVAARAWTLTAVGDVMLDRYVRTLIARHGETYPFAKIRQSLVGDVVVANLEGPLTANRSVATDTRLIFTMDLVRAGTLRRSGFTMLSLANNHTLNFGSSGLTTTRAALYAAGLLAVGDPKNLHGYGRIQVIQGQRVAFLGYHGLSSGLETIEADIRESNRLAEKTVVFAHWGSEYRTSVEAKSQQLAHRLIDAGADIIIGAHPHVIQPVEVYKGKFIAYSLGNFIFDQYWSRDVQRELLLHIDFVGRQTKVYFVPLISIQSQPHIADPETRQQVLNRLADGSALSIAQKSAVRNGILTLP